MKNLKKSAKLVSCFCLALIAALILPYLALAAGKSFVIAPFAVNAPQSYQYLSKALPSTIQGKLDKAGILTGKTAKNIATSALEAGKIRGGADYAVWGSVSVVGSECVIELNSVDKNGKTWSKSASVPVSGLSGAVNDLASAMATEAFGVPAAGKYAGQRPGVKQTASQPNSDILVNETGQRQVYLNPQFRYQGAGTGDGSRLRSQRLKQNMVDMAVADFNGDGKNEIAILGDNNLEIYLWEISGKLKQLGETVVSPSNNNFSMRAIDLNRDGASELVIATFEEETNRPYSYFFSFKGNKFSQVSERIPYFASVMKTPPTFAPVLVGQGFDTVKLYAPSVHQLVKTGGKYALGGKLSLPPGATVFNCAWIPAGKAQDGDLLLMLTEDEKIKVFQGTKEKPLHTTMERFSGSAVGMDFYKSMPGLGIDKNSQLPGKLFAPMRMIAADIGNTGENVILLNKPISTASQFFDRYRYFPQGEIHALYWDGVGLGLKWKTRRIRGSVAEVDLADVNNDGIIDLVVGINTSPELGLGSRQCMVTAYPLDVSQTDPNTPSDMSDFEVSPNR